MEEMLLPVIYLSKHWKAIECWKNQHFQLKKVLPFTERVFSQPYIQLKILTISFTLSKQVFQKIHFKFFFIYIHLYMVHFTKDRYAHKNNDKNLC